MQMLIDFRKGEAGEIIAEKRKVMEQAEELVGKMDRKKEKGEKDWCGREGLLSSSPTAGFGSPKVFKMSKNCYQTSDLKHSKINQS